MPSSSYSIGIEEEFFVFDAKTRRAVRTLDPKFLARAKAALGDRVMTEMLQSQIEVATPPCTTLREAREALAGYRRALVEAARGRGIGIAALGTFPLAFWQRQEITPKARYDKILDDLQMVGYRNMLCGLHVHVEVPDPSTRINLMMRLTPYLPLLLALSVSSPFWQGNPTGLAGYRLAAYDELPRTGLPELFRTNEDFDEYIAALVGAKIIPDSSYIWWAIRPSPRYPTLELRVADSCTRLDDAIGIAALYRCLVRALDRDTSINAGFDRVGRAITAENKWHAQRHGVRATFIDPITRKAMNATQWLAHVTALVSEDAAALGCKQEIAHLRQIVSEGGSASRQVAVFEKVMSNKQPKLTALKAVVDWAAQQTAAV